VARLAAREAGECGDIPRGTPLRSSPVAGTVCRFRTVYPVTARVRAASGLRLR
jgi:hypothetical protein